MAWHGCAFVKVSITQHRNVMELKLNNSNRDNEDTPYKFTLVSMFLGYIVTVNSVCVVIILYGT